MVESRPESSILIPLNDNLSMIYFVTKIIWENCWKDLFSKKSEVDTATLEDNLAVPYKAKQSYHIIQ